MNSNDQFDQYRALNIKMREAAEALERSPLELECVEYIGRKEEPTTVRNMFNDLSHFPRSSISRITTQLVQAGLVKAKINPDEPRNSIIDLTDKGKEAYKVLLSYFS